MEKLSYSPPLCRVAALLISENILTGGSHEGYPVEPIDPEIIE